MEFEWDPAKSETNRIERGLPFGLVVELFEGIVIDAIADRGHHGELRHVAIGSVNGVVLVCVYTDRGSRRRIISLRHANRRERHAYRAAAAG
jgi:uncharacterized protein